MKTVIPQKQKVNTISSKAGNGGVLHVSKTKTVNVNLVKVSKSVYNENRVKAYKPLVP